MLLLSFQYNRATPPLSGITLKKDCKFKRILVFAKAMGEL